MLTVKELHVVELLGDVYNEFMMLPEIHPDDINEFGNGLHVLQNIVMSRSAVRCHPDVFTHMSDSL
jgi:hypothetical protein